MFRKMFAGGGHLGFNSSVHSPIKNFVEGGATGLDLLLLTQNQSPMDWRFNVRLGWCSYE